MQLPSSSLNVIQANLDNELHIVKNLGYVVTTVSQGSVPQGPIHGVCIRIFSIHASSDDTTSDHIDLLSTKRVQVYDDGMPVINVCINERGASAQQRCSRVWRTV